MTDDPPIEWLNMLNIRISPHAFKLSMLIAIVEVVSFVAMIVFVVAYVVTVLRKGSKLDRDNPSEALLAPRQLQDSKIQRPSYRRGTLIGGEGISVAQEEHLYGGPLRYRGGGDTDKMAALEKMHHGMVFNPTSDTTGGIADE